MQPDKISTHCLYFDPENFQYRCVDVNLPGKTAVHARTFLLLAEECFVTFRLVH